MIKIRHLDVHPRDRGRPSSPQMVAKAGAGGLGYPPLAGFVYPADNIILPAHGEPAHRHICPGDIGIPCGPELIGKTATVAHRHPPVSGGWVSPGNVSHAVATEIPHDD